MSSTARPKPVSRVSADKLVTKVPSPRLTSSTPTVTSALTASRVLPRETPSRSLSCASGGSRSPGPRPPSLMRRLILSIASSVRGAPMGSSLRLRASRPATLPVPDIISLTGHLMFSLLLWLLRDRRQSGCDLTQTQHLGDRRSCSGGFVLSEHTQGQAGRTARITGLEVTDVRFPTSKTLDGSDAMNPEPDYSAAYVTIRTDDPRPPCGPCPGLHHGPWERHTGPCHRGAFRPGRRTTRRGRVCRPRWTVSCAGA